MISERTQVVLFEAQCGGKKIKEFLYIGGGAAIVLSALWFLFK